MGASRGNPPSAARTALLLLAAGCAQPADLTGRPNIVLLLADDLGWGDVSAFGGRLATPSIDSLARGGARLTDAYATAPVCNPSRAGLLSGRYQQRFGLELNSQTLPPEDAPAGCLPESVPTLAEVLADAGYATGAIGKWQLGMDRDHDPLARGFDSFFGYDSTTDYVDPRWPGVRVVAEYAQPVDPLLRDRAPAALEGYLTDEQGRAACAFIEEHREEPFFLYVAFSAPHAPLQVTQEYYERYPELEPEVERVTAAMIAALDDAVGAVLRGLEGAGVAERTLVVFLSDNGAEGLTDLAARRNAPYSGHKGTLYEGGIRVPCALRWPGRVPAGVTYAEPVSALDVCATALAAAGAAGGAGALDGVDLLPFLRGERAGAPHDALFWRSGPNAAARRGPWKLLRTGDGRRRLFDLARDPAEEHDLARERPDEADGLERALDAWSAGLPPARASARTALTELRGDAIEWHL